MKNKLRLNNLIHTTINDGDGILSKVIGLGKDIKVDIIEPFNCTSFTQDCIQLVPIPLTEEWLDRSELEKMPESEYTMNTYDFCGFKLWCNNGKFLFADKIEIETVHHLQNLFFDLKKRELKI